MMLVIYGPTTTGKTGLAIKLANLLNGELISADSRQVYKGLDIGSGKVSFGDEVERHKGYWVVNGIKINGFDLIAPGSQFTAADFVKFSSSAIKRITQEGKLPIIVGGTGFYIKSLIDGLESFGIPADPKLRSRLEKMQPDELYLELFKFDKKRAKSMNESDRKNPRRLIRAIEIALHSKKNHTPNPSAAQPTNLLIIGLTAPNEFIYQKADDWLKERIAKGLIEEVKTLLKGGIEQKWLGNLGLEYKWISMLVRGEIKQNEATDKLKGDIHSFIRRQKTWFTKFKNIKLFDVTQGNWQNKLEKTAKDWYDKKYK